MDLYLGILLPGILCLVFLYQRKITLVAFLLAWGLTIIITYFGGFSAFAALVITCVLVVISDKFYKQKKDETRGVSQIISRFLIPSTCILLYWHLENNIVYIMYYIILASSLADTFSSSVGILSKKKPINILTFEKIEKGASGGISILGLLAALLGGIIIGAVYLVYNFDLIILMIIIILSFIGSIMDSLLGIIFQAQYRCIVCKKVVETNKHCRKKTKLIKGLPLIENNLVNFLSNLIIFIISYLILI